MAWTPDDDGQEPHGHQDDGQEPYDYPRVSCTECKHLYIVSRGAHWSQWLCQRAPAAPRYNGVTGRFQAEPPWLRCAVLNPQGLCDRFQPGTNDMDGPRRPRDAGRETDPDDAAPGRTQD